MKQPNGAMMGGLANSVFAHAITCVLIATLAGFAFAADDSDMPPDTGLPAASSSKITPPSPAATPKAGVVAPESTTNNMVSPSGAAAVKAATPGKRRSASLRESRPVEVEPAKARLKLKSDTSVFFAPSRRARRLTHAPAGKFVNVTGSTHYFLQVRLKDGQTGYIPPDSVELVRSADKVFRLTKNASVLSLPNRWGKKLSEVHQDRDVHVIGTALGYMKIRMKSGLEGFIPDTALE